MQKTPIFTVNCMFDPGTKAQLSGPGTFYIFLGYLSGVPDMGYYGMCICEYVVALNNLTLLSLGAVAFFSNLHERVNFILIK